MHESCRAQRETAAIQYEKLLNEFAAQSVTKIFTSDVLEMPRWLLDVDTNREAVKGGNRFEGFANTGAYTLRRCLRILRAN